ncbi:MAG TPA: choice-of-anchor Q domain-containing protein, partial [Acidimicrobiales bacterium]|nr:choice-of-anchor Q domain-containing protein [Acidimicrobiales bacterium]
MATKVVTAAFALCLMTGFLFVVPAAADPGTLYVSALGSDGSGSNCTLPDTPCATLTYALTQAGSGSTIDMAGTVDDNVTVNTPVTITQWPGGSPAVVDGGAINSVFTIASGVTATLDQLTIQDGAASAAGGGIDVNANANLTVTSSTVTANNADTGGGISNAGTLTVTGTTLSGNTATAASGVGGGGIDNVSGATTTLTDSTVSGNSAVSGAGLYNSGTTFVTDSTVSGNMGDLGGGDGGGIDNESSLNLSDSTLSGNSSSAGGGLYNGSLAVLDDSTVSGNSVTAANSPPGSGSGILNDAGSTALAGDIVATPGGAPAGGECFGGGFYDGGYNVDDDGSCGLHASTSVSDSASIDSYLGPLADNGGPTQTVALTAGTVSSPNPAQAVIPASFVSPYGGGRASCSQPDQRGVARSAPCDMGSFALSTPTAPTITSATSGTFTVGTAGSFEVTASGSPAPTFSETGVLPDGVTLAGDGLLSGTPDPTTGGSYPITIGATNGVSPDATQAFTLTVDEA